MQLSEPTVKPFSFANPRQERIYQNLLLIGPGPAAFYRDACRLMAMDPLFETTAHLVAHLFREIESALRDVLEPIAERMERLAKKRGTSREEHKAEILAIIKALEIAETDPVARAWLNLAGKSDQSLHGRAHRRALAAPRPVDEEFRRFFDTMEAILDFVLQRFKTRYLAYFQLLDELLRKPFPSEKDVKLLRNHVPQNFVTLGYFFDKLTNPAWLKPLREAGYFMHPPEPDFNDEKKTIGFPPWPESRYLARMASLAPQEVLEVILKIPETENVRVHEDLVDAALAMPPELAAQLVEKAKVWARSPYQFLLPEKLGSLVAHLAKGGEVDKALELAQVLLEPIPSTQPEVEFEIGGQKYRFPPELQARFDTWQYEQILKKDFPVLVQEAGMKAFDMLCDLLEEAVRLSGGGKPPEDYSIIWRPAIEGHEQNLHTLKDVLVSAVRDTAEQLAQADTSEVPVLVQALEARPWKVFHRIALHLLRRFPSVDTDLLVKRLTDRSLFDDFQHEYRLLLKEHFGMLSPDQQNIILGWIEAGPEEVERHLKVWQRDRLALIQTHLPPNWKEFYDELVAEIGEPEHPEFVSYITTLVGPTSPKSVQELSAMSIDDIVQFLKSWQPSGEMFAPSREGLGRILSEVVAKDPKRFASGATKFEGLDPTYVRALLRGLCEAIENKRGFDWAPVLRLCQWVVSQPREIPGRVVEIWNADPDWGWTRKTIARLLSEGFREDEGMIPFNFRSVVWEILYALTEDPNPTPEDEAKYGGSDMDPVTLSINTTRGEAMHAVVQYALWVHRHLEKLPNGTERLAHGFDEMPEVREVLDKHLNPKIDPSLAIRAVYGQWFPWLVLLDRSWAADRVNKIFPTGESERPFRDAAWGAYITFCKPCDDVFEVLRDQYATAVKRIKMTSRDVRLSSERRLAEHLMVFYLRGKIELEDSLLTQFWNKAHDALRGHALEFVGRMLYDTKGGIPKEIQERLIVLWEKRAHTAASLPENCENEMAAFGWWFASGKFDDSWAIEQILKALKIAGKVVADHLVMQRLAEIAPHLPLHAINVLAAMIRGDKEGWRILGWQEEARKVLKTILASPDQEAIKRAKELINELLAKGFLEFRDLLG